MKWTLVADKMPPLEIPILLGFFVDDNFIWHQVQIHKSLNMPGRYLWNICGYSSKRMLKDTDFWQKIDQPLKPLRRIEK